ncbi:MAG: FAD-dependent oxidoreductase, partial [Mycobacteriaceae bacterium]
MQKLSVVGAGGIGLSIAWRAARAGWQVTVHDPEPARGASWVAGGMLAPLTEGSPGETAALALNEASLLRWPEFSADLARSAGMT